MDLTDEELSFLLSVLLDDARDKINHGLDGYDEEQTEAYNSLSSKALTEARTRKETDPATFWWVH